MTLVGALLLAVGLILMLMTVGVLHLIGIVLFRGRRRRGDRHRRLRLPARVDEH
jgi:hypothetical protein